jgi:hypothetical protein
MMGELQRQGRVFESGHGRNEMKGLEDDAKVLAPEAGQGILAKLASDPPRPPQPGRMMAAQGRP